MNAFYLESDCTVYGGEDSDYKVECPCRARAVVIVTVWKDTDMIRPSKVGEYLIWSDLRDSGFGTHKAGTMREYIWEAK